MFSVYALLDHRVLGHWGERVVLQRLDASLPVTDWDCLSVFPPLCMEGPELGLAPGAFKAKVMWGQIVKALDMLEGVFEIITSNSCSLFKFW